MASVLLVRGAGKKLDYNFVHRLYISEMCILHWLLWVCCGYGNVV